MVDAGVPVIPGCQKALTDVKEALEIAKGIGFPVIVKAVLGGGGKECVSLTMRMSSKMHS